MEYNIQHMRQRHLNQPTHRFLTVKFYLAIVLILTLHTTNVLGSTLGSKCQHDMDCTDFIKGSSCSAQGYCECAPYFVQFNTTTCLSSQLLGGDCTLNEQCTMKVSNSSCLDGACRCVEGFLQFRKHTCLGPARPGSVCYSHAHCQMYSTRTHCDFLIPNLFGRCQCTAPAKLKNGICVDSSMDAITTEAAVELAKPSTTSSTTTTTTTSTTPVPLKETEAPLVHVDEEASQVSALQQHPVLADPIQEVSEAEENANISVEEQEWEDDRDVGKPLETLTDVKIESSTQQMPLTPAQIPELQEPVVSATENVENLDIGNGTDDYPYKIEEEYNEESAVPQQIEDTHKEDEQPIEDYGNALDNTMNFDYGTAQHEMEQELEEEQNLMQQESELQQAHVAAPQLTNQHENVKDEEHVVEQEKIEEHEVNVVPEIEETIIVPTHQPTAEEEDAEEAVSLSDSLISQSVTNEIHHHQQLAEEEDEVVAENESVQNENESTTQHQQPEAVLVNDQVITTQPAIANYEKEEEDKVENDSHNIQEQQLDGNDKKTEVDYNELEKLENQQFDENITEGHILGISVEQQQQQEMLDETTVKMPQEDSDIDDDTELQVIEDLEKQEEHINILTEQPEKIQQTNLDDNDNVEKEIDEVANEHGYYDQIVLEETNMEEHTTLANIQENSKEDEVFQNQSTAEENQILENELEKQHQNIEDEEKVTEHPQYLSENVDNAQEEQIPDAIDQEQQEDYNQVEQTTENNSDNQEQYDEFIDLQEPLEQHENTAAVQEVDQIPTEQHVETIALKEDEQKPVEHEDTTAAFEEEQTPIDHHEESNAVPEDEQTPIEQHEESNAEQAQEPLEEQFVNESIAEEANPIIVDIEQQNLGQEEVQPLDEEKDKQELDQGQVSNHLEDTENMDEMKPVFQNEEVHAEDNQVTVDENQLETEENVQHTQEIEDVQPPTMENELADSLDHEEIDNLEQTTMVSILDRPEEEHEVPEKISEIESVTEQIENFEESTQIANEVDELHDEENDDFNQIDNFEEVDHIQNEHNPEYTEVQQTHIIDKLEQEELKKDETQIVVNSSDQDESESQIIDVPNNQENEMVEIESVTESIAHDFEPEIIQESDITNDEVPSSDEKIEDNEIAETEQHETDVQQVISPEQNNNENNDNAEIENAVVTDIQPEVYQTEIPNEEFFSLAENLEDNFIAETEQQDTEQHDEIEAQHVSPEQNNIENNKEAQNENTEIGNENHINEPENSFIVEDQQNENHDLDELKSEEFKENESISDILNDLMKEEVTVQPDFFQEMENGFPNENKQPEEVPDLIAEDSNISEEKVISQHLPAVEGTEGPIDPEDKLITFYPDMQDMQKQQEQHQAADTLPEAEIESSGDDKPDSLENEIIDHPLMEQEIEQHRTLSPLELPFDTHVDYRPQELESENLVVETTTISSSDIKTEENEQSETTTIAGDIAELTTQTMLNLASRVTLMEPSAPIATTLKPLMSGNGHDEVTTQPALDAHISEVFLTTKPTTEIRKRVELSLEAISLGLKCSTNKQCQLADPHTVCNAQGVCDCAASTYAHSTAVQCGAERTGCAPGTFQCRSSGVCISWFFVCDGRSDCNDASDEECTLDARHNQTCPSQAFQCGQSGRCISRAALCDGRKQCPQGEDEHGCNDSKSEQSCPPHTFRCKSGECLPEYEYCNAIISCRDGSDEPPHLCGSRSMPNFFLQLLTAGGLMNKNIDANAYCPHRCSNGRCRSTAIVCSGRDGCGDGTDEQTCSVCRCPAVSMNKPLINVSDFLARHRPMPLW